MIGEIRGRWVLSCIIRDGEEKEMSCGQEEEEGEEKRKPP